MPRRLQLRGMAAAFRYLATGSCVVLKSRAFLHFFEKVGYFCIFGNKVGQKKKILVYHMSATDSSELWRE
jgi:hypothetical protein